MWTMPTSTLVQIVMALKEFSTVVLDRTTKSPSFPLKWERKLPNTFGRYGVSPLRHSFHFSPQFPSTSYKAGRKLLHPGPWFSLLPTAVTTAMQCIASGSFTALVPHLLASVASHKIPAWWAALVLLWNSSSSSSILSNPFLMVVKATTIIVRRRARDMEWRGGECWSYLQPPLYFPIKVASRLPQIIYNYIVEV